MATRSPKPETAATGETEEKSPEQLEAEIEATREELGDTVAELADKADVKKQAKRKLADTKAKATAKKDELKEKAAAQKQAATAKASETTPDSARAGAQQVVAQVQQLARENPVQTAAIGAFVGGLVVGWFLARR
jgi:ElaB/YqjD/DUF883 family membrane-anchored ribosome-binding protein